MEPSPLSRKSGAGKSFCEGQFVHLSKSNYAQLDNRGSNLVPSPDVAGLSPLPMPCLGLAASLQDTFSPTDVSSP